MPPVSPATLTTLVAFLVVFAWALGARKRFGATASGELFSYLIALFAVFITVSMVIYPDAAFQSAVDGLKIWWDIVFPALLPFFIGSQILMGLGVVHFMGVLMEPLMRPLFNLPGVGSFVLAMGLASGYPLGAILTAKLRADRLCSRTEAERLMSTANTADPVLTRLTRSECGAIPGKSRHVSGWNCTTSGWLSRWPRKEAFLSFFASNSSGE